MTGRKKIYIALIAAAAVIGLGFWATAAKVQVPDKDETASPTSAAEAREVTVRTMPVEIREFEDRLIVQGNLEAHKVVVVSARIPGIIEEIYVDEGDLVEVGKTLLFQIDALKLSKAVSAAANDLEAARHSLKEKIANLEKIEADVDKSLIDYKRYKRLQVTHAVSLDAFETKESEYKKNIAEQKHAQALVDLTRETVRQAEAGLAMAEKDLRDAAVFAPITGVVSKRYKEPGEMGGAGQAVVRLEDTTVLEAVALLPAGYYPRIKINDTRMKIRVYSLDLGEMPVTYKSPTIAADFRTFEIKALIDNAQGLVAPGCMADLEVLLDRRQSLGLLEEAVLQRGGKSVVFVVKDGRALMVEVEKGLENEGWVEVRGQDLEPGTPVVTMGQTLIEDGDLVKVSQAAN